MMLNGVLAALVAITAASGFVAPWAAIVIGIVSGCDRGRQACSSSSGSASTTRSARSPCTECQASGARSRPASSPVPALASNLATGTGGLVYTGSFHQLGVQALGLVTVGAFTFSASLRLALGDEAAVGHPCRAGDGDGRSRRLEHGMWGYPEFYIPVPGGYGTEAHGHLGLSHGHARSAHLLPSCPAPRRAGARLGADATSRGVARSGALECSRKDSPRRACSGVDASARGWRRP